ncbi:AAA family ATPase [Candidatus Woesearchaeota archaeon]|nr:AAA family ATPase [Candidatus Woesearchaeota archaeon]
MVYKIGLISTHGTGKTALAGLVEGELKRRGIEALAIREMSTRAREQGLPINEETTLPAQLWILHRQFAEELLYSQERKTGHTHEVIICDRGPDNYCYLQHRCGDDEYALKLTLGHLQKFPYAKLYLLPITEETILPGGGTRSVNAEFQKVMDIKIRQFLQAYNLAFMELPKPHAHDNFRDEWVKIIVNQTLKDLGAPPERHM